MGKAKFYFIRLFLLPLLASIFHVCAVVKNLFLCIFQLFVTCDHPHVVRTPSECFKGLDSLGYDFAENYVELPIGGGQKLPRVHYVDEGPRDAKETVLCLHGEPSWSFLYRKVIKGLVNEGHRVIAMDFIGFGKSDKYTHPEAYSHFLHKLTLRLLLDHLQVKNITLVCQDWGGLTGLNVVQECPHLFSRLVIMNTGLPSGEHLAGFFHFTDFTPFLLWRAFANLFATKLPIKFIFSHALRESSDKVIAAYEAPFPSSKYLGGAARWPLLVPVTSDFVVAGDMKASKDYLKSEWKKPVLLMFSDNDAITQGEVPVFSKMFPDAKKITIHGGDHFLQEERGDELAVNINKFLKNEL